MHCVFAPATRRRTIQVVVTAVVIVATIGLTGCRASRAGRACSGGFARDATHVLVCEAGRWARLGTFRDVLLAARQAQLPRVVLIGDSIAISLGDALGNALRPRGVKYDHRTYPCGVVEGDTADPSGIPWEQTRACAPAIPRMQNEAVTKLTPDLVIVLSSWEMNDRVLDGAWFPYSSPEADTVLLDLYRQMTDRLTTSGARIVLLTVPDHVGSALQPAQADRTARTRHLNYLLAEVARRDPNRVSLVRMDDIVCPSDPCPEVVDGLGLRSQDGVHFNGPAEAGYVASRLVDRILAVPFGNGQRLR